MTHNRRSFIKLSVTAGAGLAIGSMTNGLIGCGTAAKLPAANNFGLQLYTLRDDMPKDPKGVLTKVASYGYKQIESFEGEKGIYWGMSNSEFKKLMDDLGMTIVASHCDINKDFERKAAEAAAIGMKYLICPWLGPQKSIDDFKRHAETFNQRGEVCKKNGIRFAYHNHDYGFLPLEGQLPQDVLMQNTDKDLVDYEMDIYWVVTAGQDPNAWFAKYPNRFKLAHVKDRRKGASATDKNASVVLGTGSIDFPSILKAGSKKGLEHFIVEQEAYEGTTPLKAVEDDATYMKNFRFA
jgi:sugar phosphate isomerase/epimerase